MTKSSNSKEAKAAEVITSYKGFNPDWTCRGYQFAVGETYTHNGEVEACESGFHACEYPLHVLRYYTPGNSCFAVVEQSGEISRHDGDSKVASSRITVKAEVDLPGLIKAAVKYTMDRCTQAEGAYTDKAGHAVAAAGENESATASGYSGAATASGRNGKAKGAKGCALFLVYRDVNWKIVHAKAVIVGVDGIKADTWYRVNQFGDVVEAKE